MIKLFIKVLILLILNNAVSAQVNLPSPKIKIDYGQLNIEGNAIISIDESINEDLSVATNRIGENFQVSASSPTTFIINFSHFSDLSSFQLTGHELVGQENINRQNTQEEYALVPIRNTSTNQYVGIVLAADTVQGWQYATDWLIEQYNLNSNIYNFGLIHDYAYHQERSLFPSASLESLLDYWKERIDLAARLRISELAFSIQKDKKILFSSTHVSNYDSRLFNVDSPFILDLSLLTSIVEYANLRGIKIVPTITHPSSFELHKYYPEWTMPNGRAIDWRKTEPREFLSALIQTVMEIDGIKRVSIWADEGGVVDRQADFISLVRDSVNTINNGLINKVNIRFLLTPVVIVAMRTGLIPNLNSLLPPDTIIDIYGGVEYLGEPGTYHIENPIIWRDIVNSIETNLPTIEMTGVGFVKRSRFNGINLPTANYFDSFIDEIAITNISGEYMYAGAGLDVLDTLQGQYVAHKLWLGNEQNRSAILANLPSNDWLSAHIDINVAWEDLTTKLLLAHFQRIKTRLDKSPTETVSNFNKILAEVMSSVNQQHIDALDEKITLIEALTTDATFQTDEQLGKESLELTLIMAKFVKHLRILALKHSETINPETHNYISLQLQQEIHNETMTLFKLCDDSIRYRQLWTTARHLPLCTYLPFLYDLRQKYSLPSDSSLNNLFNQYYAPGLAFPDEPTYHEFIGKYRSTMKNQPPQLSIIEGSYDSEYGYSQFDYKHPREVNYTFPRTNQPLDLVFELFDIDDNREIEISVNGNSLFETANDLVTVNKSWGDIKKLTIPSEYLFNNKPNLISFKNSWHIDEPSRKFIWGVRGVKLEPQKTFSFTDSKGYGFFDRANPDQVTVSVEADMCTVSFSLYDIDSQNEAYLKWNNQLIPINLNVTPNATWSQDYIVNLCDFHPAYAENSILEIVNRFYENSSRPHTWGVGNVQQYP